MVSEHSCILEEGTKAKNASSPFLFLANLSADQIDIAHRTISSVQLIPEMKRDIIMAVIGNENAILEDFTEWQVQLPRYIPQDILELIAPEKREAVAKLVLHDKFSEAANLAYKSSVCAGVAMKKFCKTVSDKKRLLELAFDNAAVILKQWKERKESEKEATDKMSPLSQRDEEFYDTLQTVSAKGHCRSYSIVNAADADERKIANPEPQKTSRGCTPISTSPPGFDSSSVNGSSSPSPPSLYYWDSLENFYVMQPDGKYEISDPIAFFNSMSSRISNPEPQKISLGSSSVSNSTPSGSDSLAVKDSSSCSPPLFYWDPFDNYYEMQANGRYEMCPPPSSHNSGRVQYQQNGVPLESQEKSLDSYAHAVSKESKVTDCHDEIQKEAPSVLTKSPQNRQNLLRGSRRSTVAAKKKDSSDRGEPSDLTDEEKWKARYPAELTAWESKPTVARNSYASVTLKPAVSTTSITPNKNGNSSNLLNDKVLGSYEKRFQQQMPKEQRREEDFRNTNFQLIHRLAEINENAKKSEKLIDEKMKEQNKAILEKKHYTEQVKVITKTLDVPKTVCTASGCVELKSFDGSPNTVKEVVYKTACHAECNCIQGPQTSAFPNKELKKCWAMELDGEHCRVCGCPWNTHLHLRHELEKTTENVEDPAVRENISKLNKQIREAEDQIEWENMRKEEHEFQRDEALKELLANTEEWEQEVAARENRDA